VLVPEFPHIHEEFTEIAKERKARSDSSIKEVIIIIWNGLSIHLKN